MLDGQFHADTKVLFALQGERTGFHVSSQRAHPLPQANESQARARCAFHPLSSASIVEHLGPDSPILLGESNETVLRTTVPDNVGHPFAHRPGQHGGCLWWKGGGERVNLIVDPR